ncbi:hypothetical protein [Pseudosulfitobacter koreensis]|uniref:Hybrid cluster protein-associated redox disulfide domain-containing protein n=1 Tax=Pseudosulfitobacter koreensis TaxID=2968472 RepID=A0ABT1Z507_9RHOB|nr:hypothetical protein [Pseudosulfitobacter koreense]MCR8828201.1 hypothetical protein [Pseudosulfitobacter koreense]
MRHDALDLPLSVLMARWPQTIQVFMRHRMLCVGCAFDRFCTVTDVCREYGIDQEIFLQELQDAVDEGMEL